MGSPSHTPTDGSKSMVTQMVLVKHSGSQNKVNRHESEKKFVEKMEWEERGKREIEEGRG